MILAPLSLLGYWFYRVSKASGLPLVPELPLMALPALAAAIARLILREGFADVSFRFGSRRGVHALVLGVAVPLIVGSLAYGTAYLTGLAQFAPLALRLLAPAAGPVSRSAGAGTCSHGPICPICSAKSTTGPTCSTRRPT